MLQYGKIKRESCQRAVHANNAGNARPLQQKSPQLYQPKQKRSEKGSTFSTFTRRGVSGANGVLRKQTGLQSKHPATLLSCWLKKAASDIQQKATVLTQRRRPVLFRKLLNAIAGLPIIDPLTIEQ